MRRKVKKWVANIKKEVASNRWTAINILINAIVLWRVLKLEQAVANLSEQLGDLAVGMAQSLVQLYMAIMLQFGPVLQKILEIVTGEPS